ALYALSGSSASRAVALRHFSGSLPPMLSIGSSQASPSAAASAQSRPVYATAAAQSHIAAHAAYIAWQVGRPLDYDPVKNEFINDEEANRMRSRARRQPWHI
ncbi:MAG: hypothetical protein IJG83_05395, partial [Thermoguttaceae bacterium]|nr:hypothetical protein [Thermoguttaceae bacterium]